MGKLLIRIETYKTSKKLGFLGYHHDVRVI